MFMMPFHPYDRDYGSVLAEDQEAIVLADRLGFTARPSWASTSASLSERITSPLIFLATLAPRTERIVFGTGVLNLPPDAAGHGGGLRGHVRPSLSRALHHGHRPGRPGERPSSCSMSPRPSCAPR